jgi:acid phosphatase type 7
VRQIVLGADVELRGRRVARRKDHMQRTFALVGAVGILACVVAASRCGGSPASSTGPTPMTTTLSAPAGPAVLVGAGDIGVCGSSSAAATGQLLDAVHGTVFTTGDNAYPNGSEANYRDCYEPHWGRHRARTRPVPGNHEYEAGGGAPYFNYFGENAGPFGLGYYSYRAGAWHVVALNSEVPSGPGSAQIQWLRAELSSARSRCTLAYFHKPLFSSGPHGANASVREIWRVLYEFDADVVISGHDHLYERFGPQDPDGRADSARGIRQFTVGTGGAALYGASGAAPNSEASGSVNGVLKLTLTDGSYQWQFLPIPGAAYSDGGFGQCH